MVGTRPHALQRNFESNLILPEYFARHNVKHGITDWAQVNGLCDETNNFEKIRRSVDYDLAYTDKWSLLSGIKIVAMTAVVTWFHQTDY